MQKATPPAKVNVSLSLHNYSSVSTKNKAVIVWQHETAGIWAELFDWMYSNDNRKTKFCQAFFV